MSAGYEQQEPQQHDAVTELVMSVLKFAGVLVLGLIVLPLIAPLLTRAFIPPGMPERAGFWRTTRLGTAAAIAGAVVVVALLVVEAVLLWQWIAAGSLTAIFDAAHAAAPDGFGGRLEATWNGVLALLAIGWPWALLNLTAGLLLAPASFKLYRRRLAHTVWKRYVPDVVQQERIESARARAADHAAAARTGVVVDRATGEASIGRRPTPAPLLRRGRWAFGATVLPTIRTLPERFVERRRVPGWMTHDGRWIVTPDQPGANRFQLIAESGVGKSNLINGAISCHVKQGFDVVFIDAKGKIEDAEETAAQARLTGGTAAIVRRWDFFNGTADQVTTKLMLLLPQSDGDGAHYTNLAKACLQAVQAHSPIRSIDDMRERLQNPAPYTRDQHDTALVMAPQRSGETAGVQAWHDLYAAIRPLEQFIDDDGWSFDSRPARVTIVPVSPSDDAQVALGTLLLRDLRQYIARRLNGDSDQARLIVIIDEFAQLVVEGTDAGDEAARLFETMRSAGVGLGIASQSVAGIGANDTSRARGLTGGAALIFGRTRDPEGVVRYAGTVMHQEGSGSAHGEEQRSARAQHTWLIPPQHVREATGGQFWIVQGGAVAAFRALPPAPAALGRDAAELAADAFEPEAAPETAAPAVVDEPASTSGEVEPATATPVDEDDQADAPALTPRRQSLEASDDAAAPAAVEPEPVEPVSEEAPRPRRTPPPPPGRRPKP